MRALRYIGLAVLAILIAGLAVPYLDATGYRERIRATLENTLHRSVTVGEVRFNLLTGPGFRVDDVTIGEDPAIGIEPMAYVETLEARVHLATLWTRHLSFSTLRLKNPSVNFAKNDAGVWNFQTLIRDLESRPPDDSHGFPAILVRAGRINFKIGDYKTIFYLSDADLDIDPLDRDRLDIRFSGQPSRTDHAAENFGRVLGRGIWNRSAQGGLDANLELERSAVSDLMRLIEGRVIGVHGSVGARLRVQGPLDRLGVTGQVRLEDVHRSDSLPAKSGGWDFKIRGDADLIAQRVQLGTAANADEPFAVRFNARELLRRPVWDAKLDLKDAPLAALLEIARHSGVSLPEGFNATGKIAGSLGYAQPGGFQGEFQLKDSSVHFANTPPLDVQTADVVIDSDQIWVGPGIINVAPGQTAEIEGSYDSTAGALNASISSRGMSIAQLKSSGVTALSAFRQGVWRGVLNFERRGREAQWSGKFDVRNALVDVDGVAGPVHIASANIDMSGARLAVTQIKARAGDVDFSGEFRRDRAGRPTHLRLDIDETSLSKLEQALLPTLRRNPGLLARFRLAGARVPEWMRARQIEASVRILKLHVGDTVWLVNAARATWDGASVSMRGIEARLADAVASGDITVDLSTGEPRYEVAASVENLPYKDGTLNLDGKAEASGVGEAVLASSQGSGTFLAEDVSFPQEGDYSSIGGEFQLQPGQRLKLDSLQAVQGGETLTGTGASQNDGRIAFDWKRITRSSVK